MNQKLIDLATWLRANPVPNLDMSCWHRSGHTGCGTTYCIIGWVAENQKFGFSLKGGEPWFGECTNWGAVCAAFQLHHLQALGLFGKPLSGEIFSFDQIVDRIERAGAIYEPKVD